MDGKSVCCSYVFSSLSVAEGYAVFDIQEKKKTTDKYTKNTNEPSATESEEKTYEQKTLFPSTNMYWF